MASYLYGQDVIIKTNKDSISSKILEVGVDEIKYKSYDNLEGPIFIIPKKNVSKLIFENGSILKIEDFDNVEMSIEETKELIVEYINKYGFVWQKENPYNAQFENNLLRLTELNRRTGEQYPYSKVYDFTENCEFHALSLRGADGYINVFPDIIRGDKRQAGYKLVIGVRGPENPEILYDALKRYSKSFDNK
tara:strand:- start:662 stop:1237 length:576 start_codon:yes stop_codon:yes gene_type:complete